MASNGFIDNEIKTTRKATKRKITPMQYTFILSFNINKERMLWLCQLSAIEIMMSFNSMTADRLCRPSYTTSQNRHVVIKSMLEILKERPFTRLSKSVAHNLGNGNAKLYYQARGKIVNIANNLMRLNRYTWPTNGLRWHRSPHHYVAATTRQRSMWRKRSIRGENTYCKCIDDGRADA